MNEAPEEVIFFGQEKNRFEKKSCKTGHNRCVYAYVNSKEEATALYRKKKKKRGSFIGLGEELEFVRTESRNRRNRAPGQRNITGKGPVAWNAMACVRPQGSPVSVKQRASQDS